MTTRFPNRGSCYVSYLPTGAARFVSALDIASLYLLARHVQILSLHSPSQIHLPSKSKPYITCLLLLILPRSQPRSRRDNKSANLLHPQPQHPLHPSSTPAPPHLQPPPHQTQKCTSSSPSSFSSRSPPPRTPPAAPPTPIALPPSPASPSPPPAPSGRAALEPARPSTARGSASTRSAAAGA